MPLHLALAAALGLLSFLSTLMLGLGQGDTTLPVLLGIAAAVSFILTDHRRIIQLGDWTVNAFAIIIVCFNIVDVLNHRGEFLAWSIARVLVFVQIVLLFREKETRFCWQILLISLLQVVVSTVFHQSILFGVLLLLYVFVGLCVFILLFLQQEHRYFRQHSFVKTLVESIKAEMAERQDRRKLFFIALVTLLMGPLTLVLSFGKKQPEQESTDQDQRRKDLRKMFLIFPTKEDLAQKEHWESVEDEPINTSPVLVESVPPFHAVPNFSNTVASSFPSSRFPLLTERPSFSAGTRNPRPWSGNWNELFLHLTLGTFFAFFLATIIFCLTPRVGEIGFSGYTLKQEFDRWVQPVRQSINVGAVGIDEDIQLGTLGSVIVHHQEVIKVRFLHNPDNSLLTETDFSANPYRAITGATFYFRGIPLDTYSEGAWTRSPTDILADILGSDQLQIQMGTTLQSQNQHLAFFEDGCDLVTLAMTIQPLETPVFFAPHPFFNISKENEIQLRSSGGRTEESRRRRLVRDKTIVSSVFKHGVQCDLTPSQEQINRNALIQVPEKGLDSLKTLAARWDAESGCSKEDIIGRARFMEQKFLLSEDFAYQLGGMIRDYDLDPLEDFIAHNPRGHCEYFAGALALMLRSVGIGSRVIIGFKTEAADYNASCTIRQSDAHAWVEVYIPPETMPQRTMTANKYAFWWQNGGWLRLDPTPASGNSSIMTALTLRWTDWTRFIQSFWDEFVLNMNQGKQMYWIYDPLSQAGHYVIYRVFNLEFWREFWSDMVQYYRSFFSEVPQHERRVWDGFYLMPPFVILALLGLVSWRLISMLRASGQGQTAEELRRRITIEFYFRMERMLSKIGLVRSAALTPLEFARQSSFMPLMLPIVEAFYRVRFGDAMLTDEESKSVLNTLETLERAIYQTLPKTGRFSLCFLCGL